MTLFGALIFAAVLGSTLAKDCMDEYGEQKCLSKADMGQGWEVFFVGGDPCFLSGTDRWCFTDNGGNMAPCKCTPECGCGQAGPAPPPAPKCDNSKVPKDFPLKCGAGWDTDNSMCIYKGMGNCGNVCNRGLSDKEKKIVLDKHNELRRKVAKGQETIGSQPAAADMNELVWDEELAVSAQRWTDQCISGHDHNRRVPSEKFVGQNYAETSSSANSGVTDFTTFVQMWYDEVKDFRSGVQSFQTGPPNTGVIGHYTAVVWAKTQKVGCGFVHIQKDGWYTKIMNCNYSPGANLLGAPVYTEGTTASKCSKENDGLCAP